MSVATRLALEDIAALRAERSRRSLSYFIRQAWSQVEPVEFVAGWHLEAIAEHLQAVSRGEIRRLVINIPPGHMKSLSVGVFWPAWTWIERPELRYLFTSYAQDLVHRDSRKCRTVLSSPWYRERWGDRFRLLADQNQKGRFDNDRGGYRIATSVGGAATGEGGDVIVCLDAGALIETDNGELPIGRIVNEQLPVRVLGSSGRWQEIETYERNPGRPLVELTTADGRRLLCTGDHMLYVDGQGYRPAREVISSYGTLRLRRLRQHVPAGSIARRALTTRPVLLAGLLRSLRARRSQSGLDGRSRQSLLRALWRQLEVVHSLRLPAEVLLDLLDLVRLHRPSKNDSRERERALSGREVGDALDGGIRKDPSPGDRHQGRRELRHLQAPRLLAGASHRWLEDEPRSDESRDALQELPSQGAYQDRDQRALDEPVRIVAVRRLSAPDAVYNLRVAPDHDYYADGLLVHNCDDPHKIEEARSDVKREEVIEWWDQTMSTRLRQPKTGAFVIVMQRLHEQDLTGHVLAQDGWTHLCLPAQYEPTHPFVWPRDPRQVDGELLWPEQWGREQLAEIGLSPYGRAGQLQQRPAPAEGGLIKRGWFRFYRQLPGELDELLLSWDMAFKDAAANDYVVGQVWARAGSQKYLVAQTRDRMDFPATVEAFRQQAALYPSANLKLVEDSANGPAVISTLRREISGLIAVRPQGSKEARVAAVSPTIEAGDVWLPDPELAPWIGEFVEEAAAFPNGAHDDQVDAMSQALLRLQRSGPVTLGPSLYD